MINFFTEENKTSSSKKRFGICDETPPPYAYIDESNGEHWVAVVENLYKEEINFIPVDHNIEIRRPNNEMDNRCDGFLYFNQTIIFVELKISFSKNKYWINDAENQLRVTIGHFEKSDKADDFKVKKAYIANKAKPIFRSSMINRMENFYNDTGFILKIENRINID